MVRDREGHDFTDIVAVGKGRSGVFDGQRDVAADEVEPRIAHQRAGQQPRLGQHLETVADAEHRDTATGRFDHRAHDR